MSRLELTSNVRCSTKPQTPRDPNERGGVVFLGTVSTEHYCQNLPGDAEALANGFGQQRLAHVDGRSHPVGQNISWHQV